MLCLACRSSSLAAARQVVVKKERKIMMEKDAKIYVAGHRGMVGSAIVRQLEKEGYHNIITRTHKELNLCRQEDVENSSLRRSRSMYSSQRQKSAVSWRTAKRWQILCMTI